MLRGTGIVALPCGASCPPSGRDRERIAKSGHSGVLPVVRAEGESSGHEGGGWPFRVALTRREEAISGRPVGSSFVKPLSTLYPHLPCRFCRGAGAVVCDICDGQGDFAKGGYHKKNPISVERIIGSKWTAMERTFGWRHFRVQSKRRGSGKNWFVEMSATCDEATRFWVNFQNLKQLKFLKELAAAHMADKFCSGKPAILSDRERWSMGWLQKTEILDANSKDAASKLVCKACKGEGRQPCTCALRNPDETVLDIIDV